MSSHRNEKHSSIEEYASFCSLKTITFLNIQYTRVVRKDFREVKPPRGIFRFTEDDCIWINSLFNYYKSTTKSSCGQRKTRQALILHGM